MWKNQAIRFWASPRVELAASRDAKLDKFWNIYSSAVPYVCICKPYNIYHIVVLYCLLAGLSDKVKDLRRSSNNKRCGRAARLQVPVYNNIQVLCAG